MSNKTGVFRLAIFCLALAGTVLPTAAQTIYRIVGSDGKGTFSDKPPAADAKATATSAGGRPIGQQDNTLPYELRQIATRYPVTLYSGTNCGPCTAGRLMLQGRGVPFVEYAIATSEDNEALQRLSGDNVLPFLTIGGQKIKGFSEAEWSQFLTAANYPAASVLPPNYRYAAAKPLVTAQKPAAAKGEPDASERIDDKSADSRPAAPPATSANPAGIRF